MKVLQENVIEGVLKMGVESLSADDYRALGKLMLTLSLKNELCTPKIHKLSPTGFVVPNEYIRKTGEEQ